MVALTQAGRLCTVTTPLGADDLIVQRFSGSESISRLFEFEIDFVSEKAGINFKDIVGKSIGVHLALEKGQKRHFHGIVARFSQGTSDNRIVCYRARVVPWLWFLTRNADCRIFQDKKVGDIVTQIFQDRGFSDFKLEINEAVKPRGYCVQYRETDFNFISRILEEEGVSYYFKHEAGRHEMVLADTPAGFATCPIQSQVEYATARGAEQMAGEVEEWLTERELQPGKYAVSDWNFETPKEPVLASTSTTNEIGGNTRFEIFDYPTEHLNLDEANQRARLRMEIEEVAAVRSFGRAGCATFTAGHRFTLKRHYRDDYNGEYLLTSVQHSITQGVGLDGEGGGSYANSFTCIPYSIRHRPSFTTPKPMIHGIQTAVVVGKKGEEIDVDKYGRVKLQFHWDRHGKSDEKSSCWIRVSQPLAGKNFGGAFWPRIGQEVVVSFLEGDPDRPLVTGRVYNAEQMPPYTPVTDLKTQSGMKTRSSLKGKPENFNELRFEDKIGEEHVFLHAEKDQHNRVKDAAFEYVGGEHHRIVKKDDFQELAMNHHRKVGQDELNEVGGSVHHSIQMDRHTKIGNLEAVESGMEIHLKAGMNVVIEAGMQLTLKGAGGFITIDPSGVTIQGTLVKVNSGGAAGAGKAASPQKPKPPKEAKKV